MKELIYNNPILQADYSDPDAIRVGKDFFMVASSFNHTPGVPILHSKNLVDWEIINYVYDEIPFKRFDDVCHGDGAWAPAIRYHDGVYYCIIPFPDEGIYVSSTTDPYGEWSDLWCVIPGKGIIDPCPIWTNGKCYMAVGFAKSRIGFNSCLGIYEVSNDLKTQITDYKIVYDGHNDNPTIEGPKFNERNGYYYIMAPAGSVKGGWQVCLRSRYIYGPYETKIVLMQNDTLVNGPHQGALIDLDNKDNWAFIHFQDMRAYGRIVHLQPVTWHNDWPLCGSTKDLLLGGSPVSFHPYLINKKSNYSIPSSDKFNNELSMIWQTPANKKDNWYEIDNGLKLNCYYHNDLAYNSLNMAPNLFLQKITHLNFKADTLVELNLLNDGDEVGMVMMGEVYHYICVSRINGVNHLQIKKGVFKNEIDEVLYDALYEESNIVFNLSLKNSNIYDGIYQLGFNNKLFNDKYKAVAGRWIGAKYGIYAKGKKDSVGYGKFKYFNTKGKKI